MASRQGNSLIIRWGGALSVACMLGAISLSFGACGGGGNTNWCMRGYTGKGAGKGVEPSGSCATACGTGVGSCANCCANVHPAGAARNNCNNSCP